MSSAERRLELKAENILALRAAHYNATLAEVRAVHADLRIFRIVPDGGLPPFAAGQFINLGLGNWERRVDDVDEEPLDLAQRQRLARRAYSISCSLWDDTGVLRRASDFAHLEFYISLVRHGKKRPPSLTPRLFALESGDRLFSQKRAAGTYTLDSVTPKDDVFFFATGTGEAPHNAMIAELLARGHRGTIVSIVSVRYLRDAGYRACHEKLMRRFSNYCYYVLSTRERPNELPWASPWSGGCHLQDLVQSGQLERLAGARLDPARAQVFLCGNSQMIGAGHSPSSAPAAVRPGSMLDLLAKRGFRAGSDGNVHYEQYE